MTRDIRVYIEDILDSITKIEQYTQTIDEQDIFHLRNKLLQAQKDLADNNSNQ